MRRENRRLHSELRTGDSEPQQGQLMINRTEERQCMRVPRAQQVNPARRRGSLGSSFWPNLDVIIFGVLVQSGG